AWLLSIIVEKSKKCVDFTFTCFFIHTVVCTFYESFPLNWEWWLIQVVASVLMASLGEYLCARKEMEDIPLYSPDQHHSRGGASSILTLSKGNGAAAAAHQSGTPSKSHHDRQSNI
ncbi:sys1, partial [Symbiodinium microadriaticum]